MNNSSSSWRLVCFGLVGAVTTFVHVAVFSVLAELYGVSAVVASVPAFLLAMCVSYTANHKWTFRAGPAHHSQLPKYAAVSLIGLSLNVFIAYFVVDVLGYWYGVALAGVVLLVPAVTFVLNNMWTFTASEG
ncbi:MAG: GtrA family protein [Methylocella sp.]